MGCTYIPSASKKLVYPDYSVSGTDVSSMDGGYYYSSHLKVRAFSLDCFFEDITESQQRKISRWLDRKTSGKQIFDDRPDVEYMVRPTKPFEPDVYEHILDGNSYTTYSGKFSMTVSAYDPFGYLTKTTYQSGEDAAGIQAYCGILRSDQMPPSPTPSSTSFLVYNCGTEPCGLSLYQRGQADNGITFNNLTNGSFCKIISLPEPPAIQLIDSDSCRVQYGYGYDINAPQMNTFQDFFEFHQDGYILQEPYEEVYRDVLVTWKAGTNLVSVVSVVSGQIPDDSFIGKYIYIDSTWRRIEDVLDDGTLVQTGNFAEDGYEFSTITTMNEITISGEDVSLTDISISVSPRVL